MTTFGPYGSEGDTYNEPMPAEVVRLHQAGRVKSGDPDRLVQAVCRRHLLQALADAGVELGDYDRQTLDWMCHTWGTASLQAILGWISRARNPHPP